MANSSKHAQYAVSGVMSEINSRLLSVSLLYRYAGSASWLRAVDGASSPLSTSVNDLMVRMFDLF